MLSSVVFGKGGNAAVRAIATLFFVHGCVFGTWSALIPSSKAQLGASEAHFGWLLFAFGLGALTGIFSSLIAMPRLGSGLVVRLSAVALLVSMASTIFATTDLFFIVSLFIVGLSGCLMDVAINEQGASAERRLQKPILSTLHALWSIGGLFGALSGGIFVGAITPLTCAVATLALLAIMFAMSQRHLLKDLPESSVVHAKRINIGLGLLIIGLFAGCCVASDGAVRDWSALFMSDTFGGDTSGASLGYGVYAGAMAVFRFFGDRLGAKFGKGQLLFVSTVTVLASLLIISSAESLELAVIGFLLFGIGIANVFPILVSLAGQEGGASGVTFVVSMAYIAALSTPPLFGWIASSMSHATIFLAIGPPFLVIGLATYAHTRLSIRVARST